MLTLKNKCAFTNLADIYDLSYEVLRNGVSVEKNQVAIPSVLPGKTCDINIPYTTAVDDKAEYVITFSLVLKKATSWSKQGYMMAQQQFKLSAENAGGTSVADPTFVQKDHGTLPAIQEKGKLKVKDNTITGKDFSITFAEDGTLANWTYRNTQLVQPNAGPDFNGFRRIANDNVNLGATGWCCRERE